MLKLKSYIKILKHIILNYSNEYKKRKKKLLFVSQLEHRSISSSSHTLRVYLIWLAFNLHKKMMLIPNIYSNSTWIWEDYFRPIRILSNAQVQILRWKYVITIMLLNLILNLCSHSAFWLQTCQLLQWKKQKLKIKEGEISTSKKEKIMRTN